MTSYATRRRSVSNICIAYVSAIICSSFCTVLAEDVRTSGVTSALMYLSRFGYMDPALTHPSALISADVVREAIIEFQGFAGLNMTGELDDHTIQMMNTPRCGVKDRVGHGSNARRKRYALQGSRWRVTDLTYRITRYPKLLKKQDVDIDVKKAFQVWADVTELTFQKQSSGKVHIEIRFESAEHGDGDPFDGPGGTLAHAYFPIYGGDAHFDESEVWTVNSYRGTNLFQVAAHEFGHSLGLSHSDVKESLMAPFYRGYIKDFELHQDDITAIQALYGVSTRTRKPSTTPRPSKVPDSGSVLCAGEAIDAIVTMENKNTYVFKGTKYWQLTEHGIATGFPRLISQDFSGLPSYLDAAFTWNNGKTYFFKGKHYWRFTNKEADPDYPKEISKGFSGIPDSVDGAFAWSGNGKIYFFKGSHYWRFDPASRPPVKENYPKDISNWEGIPGNIDDALQYSNGYSYFFKGGQYWRFNDRAFQVDSGDPPYPRPAGPYWFGCPENGHVVSSSHTEGDTRDFGGDNYLDTLDADGAEEDSAFDVGFDAVYSISAAYHSSCSRINGAFMFLTPLIGIRLFYQ